MLDEPTRSRVRDAVQPLARRLDLEKRLKRFAPYVWREQKNGFPVLHLEDVSGIPFVSVVPGVEEYQHRARVRAGTGELFAAVTPPSEGYEEYCRERLGLGSPELVHTEPGDHKYAVARACAGGRAFERIVARAREAGGLAIHPYMAIDEVWDLAEQITQVGRVPVHVLAVP